MFYVELEVFSKFPELFLLFMFLFHNRGLCSIFDIKIGCKILFISITLQVKCRYLLGVATNLTLF